MSIKQIFALVGRPTKEPIETREQKEERFKRRAKKMSTLAFLRPLEKAAEITNQRMIKEKKPLRISCYNRGKKILLEISLSETKITHDITNDDFLKWIYNITEAKGLLFDN